MFRRSALCLLVALLACEREGASTTPDEASDPSGPPSGEAPPDDGEAAAPAAKVEQVQTISGPMTKAEVEEVIAKYFREIRECFDAGLARNPNEEIDGAVVVKIQVTPSGAIEMIQRELDETGDEETATCILEEVQKWKFPAHKQPSTIRHPFYLRSY